MKKIILLATIAAMLMAFTSCQKEKDGVYQPSKKISKVFYRSGNSAKYLMERWTWDGKKLSKITDANGNLLCNFSYDGERVSRITGEDGETYSFQYDGNNLKRIECLEQGRLLFQYDFSHKNGKITKLDAHYYMSGSKSPTQFTTFNRLFSEFAQDCQTSDEIDHRATTVADIYVNYNFSYNGDNVSAFSYLRTQGSSTEQYERTYKYDKKTNPYYHFVSNSFLFMSLSKNNPVQYEHIVGANIYTYEYSYVYDGNFPTEVVRFNGSSSIETTWYEYE